MTEKQAWLTIAEAYATPRKKRFWQYELTKHGVCHAIYVIKSTYHLRSRMFQKVHDDLRLGMFGPVFCAYNPINDKLRADYCYLQYYMLGGK